MSNEYLGFGVHMCAISDDICMSVHGSMHVRWFLYGDKMRCELTRSASGLFSRQCQSEWKMCNMFVR